MGSARTGGFIEAIPFRAVLFLRDSLPIAANRRLLSSSTVSELRHGFETRRQV
jgi:hypothetical protein